MVMDRVRWAFGGRSYPSYDEFLAAVSRHNEDIAPGSHGWDPERVVSEATEIRVVYEAMWKDEDDRLEVRIAADAGGRITMGRVLHALHEASVAFFAGADHRFFEGLHTKDGKTFVLRTGS